MGWIVVLLIFMWADLGAPRQSNSGYVGLARPFKPFPLWFSVIVGCLPLAGIIWFISH
jgi:hypothetical protein